MRLGSLRVVEYALRSHYPGRWPAPWHIKRADYSRKALCWAVEPTPGVVKPC